MRLIITLILITSPVYAEDPPVERKLLKPGLVAGFTEMPERPQTTTLWRIEPAVALLMKPGEAMHPGQSHTSTSTWLGYIQIVTPGEYTFSANAQAGVFNVNLLKDGKLLEVLNDKGPVEQSAFITGKPVTLEPGFYRFHATFDFFRGTRINIYEKTRRFELLWQGPGFQREPIPYFFFGHLPNQRGKKLAQDVQVDHGRFLFEELACANCHAQKEHGFVERSGPDLTKIGARAFPGWLDAWLADPTKLRPHTTMPKMFAETDQGIAERYAVVQYLVSHGGPLQVFKAPKIDSGFARSLENGRILFSTTGCAACHGSKLAGTMKRNDDDDEPPPFDPTSVINGFGSATGSQAIYSLGGIGSKTTPDELAKFLKDPLKTNPHGRMPAMGLTNDEARDIARHLMRYTEESISTKATATEPAWSPMRLAGTILKEAEQKTFSKLNSVSQWRELGARLFVSKGCVNCHSMEENSKPVAARSDFPALETIAGSKSAGCVSGTANVKYFLSETQRQALMSFKMYATIKASPAPAFQARATLKRFNCLNCHTRDGEGGLGNELADAMKKLETIANEDDVQPPRLTGIGHKSTSTWLTSVMLKGERARPWMSLRMPQYGESNVGLLVNALPLCEGLLPEGPAAKPKVTSEMIEQGRKLVGKEGLGCVACHDINGYIGSGTRGPDLALTDRRVRHDWYDRWMHNPQRLSPGTKMPSNFTDGKSVSSLLNADAEAQINAIWAYLGLGTGLPLPSGLEPPGKGLPLVVKDRPEILRTFMPDSAGTRPIAVGFPNGAGSFVFDSHAARIAYAWEGNFLDVAPVWMNRGGNTAKLLGPKFYIAPPGQPWFVNDGSTPNFEKRANDYAYGAVVPFGEYFKGELRVHFLGYAVDTTGYPTFRYRVDSSDGNASVTVNEATVPRKAPIASGLERSFHIERPAMKTVWFLLGSGSKAARIVNGRIVIPQENDRALVVSISEMPKDATQEFSEKQVILKLPATNTATTGIIKFTIWALACDDDSLLNALETK